MAVILSEAKDLLSCWSGSQIDGGAERYGRRSTRLCARVGSAAVALLEALDGNAAAHSRVQPAQTGESAAYHDSDPGTPLKGPTSSGVTQPP
jgi:hypothetical protein